MADSRSRARAGRSTEFVPGQVCNQTSYRTPQATSGDVTASAKRAAASLRAIGVCPNRTWTTSALCDYCCRVRTAGQARQPPLTSSSNVRSSRATGGRQPPTGSSIRVQEKHSLVVVAEDASVGVRLDLVTVCPTEAGMPQLQGSLNCPSVARLPRRSLAGSTSVARPDAQRRATPLDRTSPWTCRPAPRAV